MGGIFFPLALATACVGIQSVHADEIDVTLFGQPCRMIGPMPEAQLRAIHDVGPERTPPPMSQKETVDSIARALKQTHPALDEYRHLLQSRLKEYEQFFAAWEQFKRSRNRELFLKSSPSRPSLRSAIQTGLATSHGKPTTAALESILELFSQDSDLALQELFHKALRSLKISYECESST